MRNLVADFAWSGQAKTKMSTVYLHEMSAAIYAKSAARAYPFDPISAGSHNPVSYRRPGTDLTPADTSSVKSRRPDSRVKEGLSLFRAPRFISPEVRTSEKMHRATFSANKPMPISPAFLG